MSIVERLLIMLAKIRTLFRADVTAPTLNRHLAKVRLKFTLSTISLRMTKLGATSLVGALRRIISAGMVGAVDS